MIVGLKVRAQGVA